MRELMGQHGGRQHRRGFTLIECLLAGMVLALFGSAMTLTLTQATTARAEARQRRVAAAYLDEVLTRVDMIGPAQLLREGPLNGALSPEFSWELDVTQAPASDLYTVTATISWQGTRGERSVVGATKLYDPPGARPVVLRWEDLS